MPLSEEQLKKLVSDAAEEGAKKALKTLGLEDEIAPSDIRELRNLLKAWRSAKTVIWQAILRYITTFLLGALTLGIVWKLKGE